MTMVRPGGATRETALERAVDNVATALLEESGLIVEVALVDSDADGVAALCDVSGVPAVAWLSGIGYGVASAGGCGLPELIVERGTGQRATTGETVQIIVNGESEAADVSGLAGQTFCRLRYDDFYTWLAPTMMLRAAGITNMPEAVDQADSAALIQAVAAGDCDAAGISASEFDDFAGDAENDVRVLSRTVTIPYAILMVPASLPLEERTELIDALEAMAESGDLNTLLDQDDLVRVGEGDLDELDTFLSSTGVDFAQLGG
jgi:ABC-type phosphate/phosphonate transport system substrate-binding protein